MVETTILLPNVIRNIYINEDNTSASQSDFTIDIEKDHVIINTSLCINHYYDSINGKLSINVTDQNEKNLIETTKFKCNVIIDSLTLTGTVICSIILHYQACYKNISICNRSRSSIFLMDFSYPDVELEILHNYGEILGEKDCYLDRLTVNHGADPYNKAYTGDMIVRREVSFNHMYNGIVQFKAERGCEIGKIKNNVWGKATEIRITYFNNLDQMDLDKKRNSFSYKYNHGKLGNSELYNNRTSTGDCILCPSNKEDIDNKVNKVNVHYGPCDHVVACIECTINRSINVFNTDLQSPFFNCPKCNKPVTNLRVFTIVDNTITFYN